MRAAASKAVARFAFHSGESAFPRTSHICWFLIVDPSTSTQTLAIWRFNPLMQFPMSSPCCSCDKVIVSLNR